MLAFGQRVRGRPENGIRFLHPHYNLQPVSGFCPENGLVVFIPTLKVGLCVLAYIMRRRVFDTTTPSGTTMHSRVGQRIAATIAAFALNALIAQGHLLWLPAQILIVAWVLAGLYWLYLSNPVHIYLRSIFVHEKSPLIHPVSFEPLAQTRIKRKAIALLVVGLVGSTFVGIVGLKFANWYSVGQSTPNRGHVPAFLPPIVPETGFLKSPPEQAPQLPPIEISASCIPDLDALPIKVPVGTIGRIFFLNPAVNAQMRRVLLREIDNVTGDGPKQWPDPRIFPPEIVTKERDKGQAFAARCEVTNFGQDDVFDLNIPVQTAYGVSSESPQLSALSPSYVNTIVVNPLIRGNTFRFYVVNPCPVMAEMSLTRDGKARLVREHAVRPFQFALDASNQGIELNPSEVNWSQDTCFDASH
jgi:hypothetical protein